LYLLSNKFSHEHGAQGFEVVLNIFEKLICLLLYIDCLIIVSWFINMHTCEGVCLAKDAEAFRALAWA